MYRLIVESLLGLRLEDGKLRFEPCLPAEWNEFKLRYRYRGTLYHITVSRARSEEKEMGVTVDGIQQPDGTIPLVDDRRDHSVAVRIMDPNPARVRASPDLEAA
jgi:cellobiose phosphorylase